MVPEGNEDLVGKNGIDSCLHTCTKGQAVWFA